MIIVDADPVEPPTVLAVAAALDRTVDAILDVYQAEIADQARRCRVDPYTAALAAALVRRVSRSLAFKNLPLAVIQDEAGATRLGPSDPEVRRLEAPYRKVVLG